MFRASSRCIDVIGVSFLPPTMVLGQVTTLEHPSAAADHGVGVAVGPAPADGSNLSNGYTILFSP